MRTAPCNHIKENDVMNKKTEELEEIIGYHFKNKHYLTQALTHSSYANEKKLGKLGCNERLEFLGDAVLELISSEFFCMPGFPRFLRETDKKESQSGM